MSGAEVCARPHSSFSRILSNAGTAALARDPKLWPRQSATQERTESSLLSNRPSIEASDSSSTCFDASPLVIPQRSIAAMVRSLEVLPIRTSVTASETCSLSEDCASLHIENGNADAAEATTKRIVLRLANRMLPASNPLGIRATGLIPLAEMDDLIRCQVLHTHVVQVANVTRRDAVVTKFGDVRDREPIG